MVYTKAVKIGGVSIGGQVNGKAAPLAIIAGPCVIEDELLTLKIAETLKAVTDELKIPYIFKASYDKANRTSVDSYRGPGIKEGIKILKKVASEFGVPVLTDVHTPDECKVVSDSGAIDCLQIPAYLCRQTDLLVEAGKTGLPVNIKKGQFMAPSAMSKAADKVASTGNTEIILTERGTMFGYGDLVVDFRSIPTMRGEGYPVVFDATHSVQKPSALGKSSGGDRRVAKHLARAAVAIGIDALFMEVHPDPDSALSDGPNSLRLTDAPGLFKELTALDNFIKGLD